VPTCAWNLGGDRFVEILSIDQEEPAQLFTGFGKRSIGYRRRVPEHQLRSRLGGAGRLRDTLRVELLRCAIPITLLSLGFAQAFSSR